jgi:hypothetical protein
MQMRWPGPCFCAVVLMSAAVSPGQDCVTAAAGGGWQSRHFPIPQDIFTAEFDATPSVAPLNAVIGIAEHVPVAYTDLATIARFNPSGAIDARNGAVYQARTVLRYTAGVRYHFRMTVDMAGERYSLYVTPRGGRETTVALDYDFRSEQTGIFSVEYWGALVGSGQGRVTVCGFTTAPGALDDATPPGSMVTASTDDGNVPANTVDGSLATRWSGQGDGAWIQYELSHDRNHTVALARIAAYRGDTRRNRFDLQVSWDGASWTNVITGGLTSGTTTAEETFDFPDAPANYVRYVGHGSTAGTFNSLTEVRVFSVTSVGGTPTPMPTPTPTP